MCGLSFRTCLLIACLVRGDHMATIHVWAATNQGSALILRSALIFEHVPAGVPVARVDQPVAGDIDVGTGIENGHPVAEHMTDIEVVAVGHDLDAVRTPAKVAVGNVLDLMANPLSRD